MRRKSPRWLTCSSDSGYSLHVSPRLASVFTVVELLEEDGHLRPICAFDAIADLVDLIGIGDLADTVHEQVVGVIGLPLRW
jgi:hypothetical protein